MTNSQYFNALVVGSGASGLYTALCLQKEFAHLPSYQIGLVTKDQLKVSASDWAQGGIAAVIDRDDSPTLHAEDTMRAGNGLCEATAVDILVNSASKQIQHLVDLGVDFDRHGDRLALTLEAAHSRKRVLHAADATGRALVETLAAEVLAQPQIQVLSETLVLDLALVDRKCVGAYAQLADGTALQLIAPVVVLATGGGAQVFSQNTNPPSSTGDGVAIAWRAGAVVRDLEFVQFHPTALAIPGAPRFLISEAVRGEGAYLIDQKGDRFAFNYDPRGELAPRDVVSRAVFSHLRQTSAPTVFLDLQAIAPERIAYRFPNIIKICHQWQIDIFAQPIPVTPAAHYCMGGIVTDSHGATSIPGLYAVGESASTGVHGANRLASNSLLECFVFGERLAAQVRSLAPEHMVKSLPPYHYPPALEHQGLEILALKQQLQELVWAAAGIVRDRVQLETALGQIQAWQQQLLAWRANTRLWVESRNLTDFAALLVRSALFRTESRGAHFRQDFPDTDQAWQVHSVIQADRVFASEPIVFQPLPQSAQVEQ
ncbi:MAG: L-aspartate oxidase [Pseudanabaenaceae cyanobacterium bins.68]|nr:L-aspartate oxidase [Pseudanabaenaceae cyanobacterium bins.68]